MSTGTRDRAEAERVALRLHGDAVLRSEGLLDKLKALEPLRPRGRGVYCIIGTGPYVKIGASEDIPGRIRALQTACPEPLLLLAVLSRDPREEHRVRADLTEAHNVASGEWLRITPRIARAVLLAREGAP